VKCQQKKDKKGYVWHFFESRDKLMHQIHTHFELCTNIMQELSEKNFFDDI
jgi:hypothetical protein